MEKFRLLSQFSDKIGLRWSPFWYAIIGLCRFHTLRRNPHRGVGDQCIDFGLHGVWTLAWASGDEFDNIAMFGKFR